MRSPAVFVSSLLLQGEILGLLTKVLIPISLRKAGAGLSFCGFFIITGNINTFFTINEELIPIEIKNILQSGRFKLNNRKGRNHYSWLIPGRSGKYEH